MEYLDKNLTWESLNEGWATDEKIYPGGKNNSIKQLLTDKKLGVAKNPAGDF